MARPTVNAFDDDAARRIGDAVRSHEGRFQSTGPGRSGDASRGLQVRFGITAAGSETYPTAPATVFNWKPLDRKPASLAVGNRTITNTPWTAGVRKGVSLDGGFIPEGTLVKAYKIGGDWWLEPFAGVLSGQTSGTLTARATTTLGTGTVLLKSISGSWTTVQVGGVDVSLTVRSAYSSTVASGKAVTFAREAQSGLYLLMGADC